ncbi:hypothetical protein JW826_01930 [Candidatus Woesearchaeota archaeon]|nr:hypothetical protein [Candidatus Woesearchaeota archaeon]
MAYEDMILNMGPEAAGAGMAAGIIAFLGAMMIFVAILLLAVYIYSAIAMMTIANRLKTKPSWLAWIPIANIYLLTKMAKMPWWPMLLLIGAFIPVIGPLLSLAFMVFMVIWTWKVCERRNLPGWLAVLTVIPVLGWIWGLVLWGILAWGK